MAASLAIVSGAVAHTSELGWTDIHQDRDYGHWEKGYGYGYGGHDPVPCVTATPEMSTWAMILIGFSGLGYAAYRRRETTARVIS